MKDLTVIADRYGSDKGSSAFGRHRYTEIYDDIFSQFRKSHITLLEIGLLHPMDDNRGLDAPSLRMWREYFTEAKIVGFDIDDYTKFSVSGAEILQGDVESRDDLERLTMVGPFDIVLDDASHASHHQQLTFGFLFEHLRPGGIYIIEDLNWQPIWLEKGDAEQTRHVLRRFMNSGQINSEYINQQQADFICKNISSIEFFDTSDVYNEDKIDALVVIRKK